MLELELKSIDNIKFLLEVLEVDLHSWVELNKDEINRLVAENGILLIRGLTIKENDFSRILTTIFEEPLIDYVYRSTPRKHLGRKIYTATEYPASQPIVLHNENSYSNSYPKRLGFLCVTKAQYGGNTPVADGGSIYKQIPREIREEFEFKKILYVRNYGIIDLPWQEVFQTDNKDEVLHYCQSNNIKAEWFDNRLRTAQVNPAVIKHPRSGEDLWFNQAHLFHYTNLSTEISRELITIFGKENLPRNAYFGNGQEIDETYLAEIRNVIEGNKIIFDWRENDLLLLDNLKFYHGREPYKGERKVIVGML